MTFRIKYAATAVFTALFIALFSTSVAAQIPGLGGSAATSPINLEELSRQEALEHIATITDEDARIILLAQVNAREEKKPKMDTMMGDSYISYAIMSLQERSQQFDAGLNIIRTTSQNYAENWANFSRSLFYQEGTNELLRVMISLGLIIAVSLALSKLAFHPVSNLRENLRQNGEYAVYHRLARSIIGMLLDLAKVAMFLLLSVGATLLLVEKGSPIQVFASSVLLLIATIWALSEIFRELLFSPVCRELFIKGEHSRRIYYWSMLGFFTPVFIAVDSIAILMLLQFPHESMALNILILMTLGVLSLTVGTFLIARAKHENDDGQSDVLKNAVANNRYWLIIIALLAFYLIASKNIVILAGLTEDVQPGVGYLYYALMMFIFMPMYMRIIKLLIVVQPVNSVIPEIVGLGQEEHEPQTSRFSNWVRWLFTVPYAIMVFLFALEGANIGILSWFSDGAGSQFGEAATGVLVTCMLGVVVWNVVNTYINKNLPAAVLDPTVLMGSEGGGDDQATRIQTVLPIVRNFVLAIIVVVVIFSVLASIGVNTAPLLAGAGVIGIAIGFGAQKLVQDVVSGVFFLFEDAFRIGEYIDTGSLVGTVESTSVRSLRLRHHLGAVQTIPYGEIRSVKNLSRDFVIMKLKFRVPFDTDIEVVRKTIKKVGEELLKDEELGEGFIAPLKSQGVQTAEDDALVIRMKFTCKPGKQWMIKRSAYRLVQEALAAKGIHFASRQVTVHVPENEHTDPEKLKQAAGAATLAIDDKKSNKPADPLADM